MALTVANPWNSSAIRSFVHSHIFATILLAMYSLPSAYPFEGQTVAQQVPAKSSGFQSGIPARAETVTIAHRAVSRSQAHSRRRALATRPRFPHHHFPSCCRSDQCLPSISVEPHDERRQSGLVDHWRSYPWSPHVRVLCKGGKGIN
jgi:hypothetical protein